MAPMAKRKKPKRNRAVSKYSDAELVLEVCNGRPNLYAEIVKRYQGKLFAYIYRLCNNNRNDALDVLQNVFLKAYENLRSFNTKRKFSAWIYRIAHNEAINYIKKEHRRSTISIDENTYLEETLRLDEDNQHDLVIKREARELIEESLKQLPGKYKEVLVLRYMEDKSYDEISAIVLKPMNTVATLLARGKRKLGKILKKKIR